MMYRLAVLPILRASRCPRPAVTLIAAVLLAGGPASAQVVVDGSDGLVGAETAKSLIALVGRGLKAPEAARYGRLRPGRAGAFCGDVDVVNRMGAHVGPRAFVADPAADFAGLLPDAAELRHPASVAQYQAMQRTLALLAANCSAS